MKEFKFKMQYTLAEIEEDIQGMAHLEMPDDSMKPRIHKGDLVIYDTYLKEIYREPTPLVVKLNGKTLVREAIQDENGTITLRSCSRKVQPITVGDDDRLEILGRLYGARRGGLKAGLRPHALVFYPQPKNPIDDDPLGEGRFRTDGYDSLPPDGAAPSEEMLSEEAKYLMNINPAMYTLAKYIAEAPEDQIERIEMPDDSMMKYLSPGDVILCDKRRTKTDPNFALLFGVRINGVDTVREVWRDKRGNIRIRPHNSDHPAYIIEEGDDFEIIGKAVFVAELSLKYAPDGQEIRNMKVKLQPSPRRISVSEP